MNNFKKSFLSITLLLSITAVSSCGGGSGGGGGGSTNGVRIVNAGIDAPPVEVVMEGVINDGTTTASFGTAGKRADISGATVNIGAKNKVTGNIVANVPAPQDKGGVFSLFLYGSTIDGSLRAKLLSDNAPEKSGSVSTAKVRFFNAVNKTSGLNISFEGKNVAVAFGEASEFFDANPIVSVTATTGGGGEISSRTFDLPVESANNNNSGSSEYTIIYMGELGLLVFSRVV